MLKSRILDLGLMAIVVLALGCGGSGGSESPDTANQDSVVQDTATDLRQEDSAIPSDIAGTDVQDVQDVKDANQDDFVEPTDAVDQKGDSEEDEVEAECEDNEDCAEALLDVNACQAKVCDQASGKCVVENLGEATLCDDGDVCTENDHCMEGACLGSAMAICCGDGTCDAGEICDTCPGDCGECMPMCGDILACQTNCGDQECADGCVSIASEPEQAEYQALIGCVETLCPDFDPQCVTLALDAGGECYDEYIGCTPLCGNGICGTTEDCSICATDCGTCPPVLCMDVVSEVATCPVMECVEAVKATANAVALALYTPLEACALELCPEDLPWGESQCVADALNGACLALFEACLGDKGTCGDGMCHQTEGCEACSADCGACPVCGDEVCNGDEDCDTCAQDCGACPFCGDGSCDFMENCRDCTGDCGECDPASCMFNCGGVAPSGCGCAPECEATSTCCADYGPACIENTCNGNCFGPAPSGCYCDSECQYYGDCCYDYMDFCQEACGDGQCTPSEDCTNCVQDCGACPVCGDGTCAPGENCEICEADCGPCQPVCGNDLCDGTETCGTCPADCGECPTVCGDGACASTNGENCLSCPQDCEECPEDSCQGRCDTVAPSGCSCTSDCQDAGTCCYNYVPRCIGTCVGYCGGQSADGCYCDDACTGWGDCCLDFQAACL